MNLRDLWRYRLRPQLQPLLAASYRLPVALMPPQHRLPMTLIGLFSTGSGLGRAARLFSDGLKAIDWPHECVDVSAAFRQNELGASPVISGDARGTIVVFLNAPEVPMALAAYGREKIRNRRIVGYWHWELPYATPHWAKYRKYVHEVWVPTHFVAQAMGPISPTPPRVIPYPITAPEASARTRADFGLPDNALVVTTLFSLASSAARKNPFAVINAFRQAYVGKQDARLVIKISAPHVDPTTCTELQREAGRDSRIVILADTYSDNDIAALLKVSDIIISLHRSEGFGLVLAEAMAMGKPVIGTGWSGNADFMNAENSVPVPYTLLSVADRRGIYGGVGQIWADPDVDAAAEALRKLASDPEAARRLGEQGRLSILNTYSPARLMRDLSALGWDEHDKSPNKPISSSGLISAVPH